MSALLRRLALAACVGTSIFAVAYFALWGCFPSFAAARPFVPTVVPTAADHWEARAPGGESSLHGVVGVGPSIGLTLAPGVVGFVVLRPTPAFEFGGGASGSLALGGSGGGAYAFGRLLLDASKLVSVGVELSAEGAAYSAASTNPLSFGVGGTGYAFFVGGSAGFPVAIHFTESFALFTGVSVGVAYQSVTGAEISTAYPLARLPIGVTYTSGTVFYWAEIGATTVPDGPIPYGDVGVGLAF